MDKVNQLGSIQGAATVRKAAREETAAVDCLCEIVAALVKISQ
jgi:hypothetical protein